MIRPNLKILPEDRKGINFLSYAYILDPIKESQNSVQKREIDIFKIKNKFRTKTISSIIAAINLFHNIFAYIIIVRNS